MSEYKNNFYEYPIVSNLCKTFVAGQTSVVLQIDVEDGQQYTQQHPSSRLREKIPKSISEM